jgi:hypothetical protein
MCFGEFHCYRYHQLYYSELVWDRILRVRAIRVDIKMIIKGIQSPFCES